MNKQKFFRVFITAVWRTVSLRTVDLAQASRQGNPLKGCSPGTPPGTHPQARAPARPLLHPRPTCLLGSADFQFQICSPHIDCHLRSKRTCLEKKQRPFLTSICFLIRNLGTQKRPNCVL